MPRRSIVGGAVDENPQRRGGFERRCDNILEATNRRLEPLAPAIPIDPPGVDHAPATIRDPREHQIEAPLPHDVRPGRSQLIQKRAADPAGTEYVELYGALLGKEERIVQGSEGTFFVVPSTTSEILSSDEPWAIART